MRFGGNHPLLFLDRSVVYRAEATLADFCHPSSRNYLNKFIVTDKFTKLHLCVIGSKRLDGLEDEIEKTNSPPRWWNLLLSFFLSLMVYLNTLFVSSALMASFNAAVWGSTVSADRTAQAIFPVAYSSAWSTSSSQFNNVQKLALSDSTLNVNRVSSGTTHNIVQINGKTAWEAFYPKGSMNPSSGIRGGFGFYLNGPQSWNLAQAKAVGRLSRHVARLLNIFFR